MRFIFPYHGRLAALLKRLNASRQGSKNAKVAKQINLFFRLGDLGALGFLGAKSIFSTEPPEAHVTRPSAVRNTRCGKHGRAARGTRRN